MSVSGTHGHGEIQKPQQTKELYSRVLHELKMSVESAAGGVIDDMPNYRAILQTSKMTRNVSTTPPARKATEDLTWNRAVKDNKGVKAQAHIWGGTGDAMTEKHSGQPPAKKQRTR